jgi:hypothetical protein
MFSRNNTPPNYGRNDIKRIILYTLTPLLSKCNIQLFLKKNIPSYLYKSNGQSVIYPQI